MANGKETWQQRMDRIDATLDKVGKRLDSVGKRLDSVGEKLDKTASDLGTVNYHNGIMAETFFNEATEKGVKIKGVEYNQYATNLAVGLERRKRGKISLQKLAEFDIVMLSSDLKKVLLIEVKYRLDSEDKHFFDSRIPLLKEYGPEILKGKKIDTAFASLVFKDGVIKQFQNANHYVLAGNNNRVNVFPPASLTGVKTPKKGLNGYPKKKCKTCGKSFTPKRHNHIYCKPKCRKG